MYKLVVSPQRYSAIMYASSILDDRTVVMVISDGMEESNRFNLCRDALRVQRRFELEKSYKEFSVRQLYTLNQDMFNIDYELVTMKLTLMLTLSPFTHFYFMKNGDQRLYTICHKMQNVKNKLVYAQHGKVSWKLKLNDVSMERKLNAIERLITAREEILYHDLSIEYIQR